MISLLSNLSAKVVKKPVFNQPVYTERRYHVTRALYAILLTLLATIAASVIALKAMTVNFIEDNRDTGFEFKTDDGDSVVIAALPKLLYTAPAKLALVAGATSIFVGIAHLAFVVTDWKEGKKTQAYAFRRNMMFLHFGNSIVVLLALVSISVTHKSTSQFRERYINYVADRPSSMDGMRYRIGTFDLETWSCELSTVNGARMVWEDYGRQCVIETAGRGLLICFMVVACALAGLSIWGMISKRDAHGDRIRTEQVEVEMGKMNAV